MDKKLRILGLILGIILSTTLSFSFPSYADNSSPVTITVIVKPLISGYAEYKTEYDSAKREEGEAVHTSGGAGNAFRGALGVENDSNWTLENGSIPDKKLESGYFAFGYNQEGVISSPTLSGGYGAYSEKLSVGDSATYTFTFPDSRNVQLVIASYNKSGDGKGSITGRLHYLNSTGQLTENEAKELGVNTESAWGSEWYSEDWYRKGKDYPVDGKAFIKGGLSIRQNADSSVLEITNIGLGTAAVDTTITVYVGASPIGVSLGGASDCSPATITGGVRMDSEDAGAVKEVSEGGTVSNYTVAPDYGKESGAFNNWAIVQSYVNDLTDTIKLISYAYYGFALITSILLLIYNIVSIAGATSNPMIRTRLFYRLGISILCISLLGAGALLTRLFIQVCLGG